MGHRTFICRGLRNAPKLLLGHQIQHDWAPAPSLSRMEAAKATRGAVRVRSDVEGVDGTKPSACGKHRFMDIFLLVCFYVCSFLCPCCLLCLLARRYALCPTSGQGEKRTQAMCQILPTATPRQRIEPYSRFRK